MTQASEPTFPRSEDRSKEVNFSRGCSKFDGARVKVPVLALFVFSKPAQYYQSLHGAGYLSSSSRTRCLRDAAAIGDAEKIFLLFPALRKQVSFPCNLS